MRVISLSSILCVLQQQGSEKVYSIGSMYYEGLPIYERYAGDQIYGSVV